MLEGGTLLHYSFSSFCLFVREIEPSIVGWDVVYCCLWFEWFRKLDFCKCFVFEVIFEGRIYCTVDVHFIEMIDVFTLFRHHSFRISLGKNFGLCVILFIRGFDFRINCFRHNLSIIWTYFSIFLASFNKILIVVEHFLNICVFRSELAKLYVPWASIEGRLASTLIAAALSARAIVSQLVHSPKHSHILTDIAQNSCNRL